MHVSSNTSERLIGWASAGLAVSAVRLIPDILTGDHSGGWWGALVAFFLDASASVILLRTGLMRARVVMAYLTVWLLLIGSLVVSVGSSEYSRRAVLIVIPYVVLRAGCWLALWFACRVRTSRVPAA